MRLLIILLILALLVMPAEAAYVNITIWGLTTTNNNVSKYGANNTVIVNAWNTSYLKNITVNSTNTSGDFITFNISNVSAYQVVELRINGTVVGGYQAGANGMLNFTYQTSTTTNAQSNFNKTFVIAPAVNVNGYNMTWAWVWNLNMFKRQEIFQITGAKVEDTVYRNNGTSKVVSMCVTQAGAGTVLTRLLSDSSNPPTTVISATQGSYACVWGIIAPNNYYIIDDNGAGTWTYNSWLEWS